MIHTSNTYNLSRTFWSFGIKVTVYLIYWWCFLNILENLIYLINITNSTVFLGCNPDNKVRVDEYESMILPFNIWANSNFTRYYFLTCLVQTGLNFIGTSNWIFIWVIVFLVKWWTVFINSKKLSSAKGFELAAKLLHNRLRRLKSITDHGK